jgi:hypothetical protein
MTRRQCVRSLLAGCAAPKLLPARTLRGAARLTGLCTSEIPFDRVIAWEPERDMVVEGYVDGQLVAEFGKGNGVPSGTATIGQVAGGRETELQIGIREPGASHPEDTRVVKAVRGGRFADGFESDQGWGQFEEIVDPAFYIQGAGETARSRAVSCTGDWSLLVHANRRRTNKSNHLLANKRISDYGRGGRWALCVSAYIAPETAETGQVGPEFSMQNTRSVDSRFLTATAGVQYRTNPFLATSERNGLAIWVEVRPGVAQWRQATAEELKPATWYWFRLEADFDRNRYVEMILRGGDVDRRVDLSAYAIAQEGKWSEEAFWLTLESENRWSGRRPDIYEYQVYYDNVQLMRGESEATP